MSGYVNSPINRLASVLAWLTSVLSPRWPAPMATLSVPVNDTRGRAGPWVRRFGERRQKMIELVPARTAFAVM